MAKPLRRDIQCSVELAGEVLKSNQRSEFDDGVVIEMTFKVRHQLCIHLAISVGNSLGVGQRRFDACIEQWGIFKLRQGGQVCFSETTLEAGGGVDVDTESAPVDL